MSICKKDYLTRQRPCIGAMNKKIIIQIRNIRPPNIVDFNENFIIQKEVWALVTTVNGVTIFDSSNIERVVSHIFEIRYISNVTFENFVNYENNEYIILNVENFNNNNETYILRCAIRGDDSLAVNKA